MVGVYIGSTTGYSGKNLMAMALGLRFKKQGFKVGYMKPVGAVPRPRGWTARRRDACFSGSAGLKQNPSLVTPVVVTRSSPRAPSARTSATSCRHRRGVCRTLPGKGRHDRRRVGKFPGLRHLLRA
jgi:hypothetical protein